MYSPLTSIKQLDVFVLKSWPPRLNVCSISMVNYVDVQILPYDFANGIYTPSPPPHYSNLKRIPFPYYPPQSTPPTLNSLQTGHPSLILSLNNLACVTLAPTLCVALHCPSSSTPSGGGVSGLFSSSSPCP